MRVARLVAAASVGTGAVVGAAAATYLGLITGRLSVDLGLGRRTRPLGPLVVNIAAPRDLVYAAATAAYAVRRPHAMQDKVQVLDRGDGMVLAAHRTPLRSGLVAVTIETVTFQPPARIGFRLVRGPVPYVVETFELTEVPDVTAHPAGTDTRTLAHTRLTYTGELGTDLGPVGELWGNLVAGSWMATVAATLEQIRAESERRARAQRPGPRR